MKNIRKVSHKLKNVTLLALCAFLLCTLFVFPARGETLGGACGESLSWELTGSVLTITGSGAMTEYRDGGFAPWHEARERITTVVLPQGLTSIGKYAFLECAALQSARIPAACTRIGEYAFAECKALRFVSLGTGLREIAEGAFSACESICSLELPQGLERIGIKAFYRCGSIPAVTIPASVQSVGASAFGYCYALTRATIAAPLESLPSWIFYGCGNLADVSLSAATRGVGEFAFERCENLSTIFSDGDDETLEALRESLAENGGDGAQNATVSIGKMPASSGAGSAEGDKSAQVTVTERENSTITVKRESDAEKKTNTITAVVRDGASLGDLAKTVDDLRRDGVGGTIETELELPNGTLSGDALNEIAGENITLAVRGDTEGTWKIDMAKAKPGDFSGEYDLGMTLTETEEGETTITAASVKRVRFDGSTDFNATLGIPAGQPRRTATLYQRNGKAFEKLQSVVIDDDGIAWFALANIDAKTDYYLAVDAQDLEEGEAIIPETLKDAYGINATLTNGKGAQYQITGRSSRWGITGKQFAIYAGIAAGAVILLVFLVMLTLHKFAQNKAKYAAKAAADEAPTDEEAMRLALMREMLAEQKNKGAASSEEAKETKQQKKPQNGSEKPPKR